jgi:serine phosphatase RsbU (regulator of sigma subunit)
MSEPDDEDESERTVTVRRATLLGMLQPMHDLGHYLVYPDGGAIRRVSIPATGVTVGRVAPADVTIPVPDVSRKHCRIEIQSGWASIEDLGSTNGTFLGGQKLTQRRRLHNGDVVSLGSFDLRYERRDRAEVAAEADLTEELRRANEYVRAILPAPMSTGAVQTEWCFVPCTQLGGDAFGYQYLDDDHFAGFVLDVSGHGIGSAMHAVNVANVLRRRSLPGVDFLDPGQVAAGVNSTFPMEDHNGLLLSLWYFVYEVSSRSLRFCSAGHHPSFLVAPGGEPVPLWQKSPTIGMLPMGKWAVGRTEVVPDSRLYVFSDGAFEIVTATGQAWVLDDLRREMMAADARGECDPQNLYRIVRTASKPGPMGDDFSVLMLRLP